MLTEFSFVCITLDSVGGKWVFTENGFFLILLFWLITLYTTQGFLIGNFLSQTSDNLLTNIFLQKFLWVNFESFFHHVEKYSLYYTALLYFKRIFLPIFIFSSIHLTGNFWQVQKVHLKKLMDHPFYSQVHTMLQTSSQNTIYKTEF